jgi:Tfp pilus assembly protein PilX
MKFPAPRHHQQQSMVLIMAIVAIAVITVLMLALFEGATLQNRSAQNSAILAQEEMLADSASSLVEGQIAQAASYTNETTWMSQPGLVRTYSLTNSANPRVPLTCYKLYSTTNLAAMTDTSGSVAFMSADVPANWSSQPALYVDLNTPAQAIYPIFDPAATNSVQGLSVDSPNGAQMPVAWLYQLQDGTLGPAANATAANPIVARIAFWTDDETCKININTAGIGDSWNTPRANSPGDIAAATNQPAQGEYSAYPGHPATTSLNVVFGSSNAPSAAQAQQWLGLTPRYGWGGSQFGTASTTPNQAVPAKTGHL